MANVKQRPLNHLLSRARELQVQVSSRTLPLSERAQVANALAEACFRIGVHPETRIEDAISNLRKAIRLDSTNPRNPYHLARLYFSHGELTHASVWLKRAFAICPTSHRIWAHAALLQRELNQQFDKDSKFEKGSLNQWARSVGEQVRDGVDVIDHSLMAFVPPTSRAHEEEEARHQRNRGVSGPHPSRGDANNAAASAPSDAVQPELKRFHQAGQCRWSGVHDLEAEFLISANAASKRVRDAAMPFLEKVLELSAERRGGDAAFAALAVQWVLGDYPVGTIQRLLQGRPETEATKLVHRLCAIWNSDEEAIPSLMETALTEGAMPDLLAALVIKLRVLYKPIRFRSADRYAAAVRQLAAHSIEDAAVDAGDPDSDLVKALKNALRDFHPKRQADMEDARPVQNDAAGPGENAEHVAEKMERVLALAEQMEASIDAKWDRIRKLATASKSAPLEEPEAEEGWALKDFSEALPKLCDDALADLDAVREKGSFDDLAQLDRTRERFLALKNRSRPFQKNANKLKLPDRAARADAGIDYDTKQSPAPASVSQGNSGATAVPAAPLNFEFSSLAEAVQTIDTALSDRFNSVDTVFAAFSKASRGRPAMRALESSYLHRRGEALFRLGHREEARKCWQRIADADWLDDSARRNIAVCDSGTWDVGRCMYSWSSYLEVLYFKDIILGTPRSHAPSRSKAHRDFSAAFAPPGLTGKLEDKWADILDEERWALFLNSPGRFRSFMDHKLLELWNRRLDFKTPMLIVGTGRCEDEDVRKEARESMIRMNLQCASVLSERVRHGFRQVTDEHVHRAFGRSASQESRILKRNPHYEEEERQYRLWLEEVLHLKLKIFALLNRGGWQRHLEGIEFVLELRRLDKFPIDMSPSLLIEAAQKFGKSADRLVEKLNNLRMLAIHGMVVYLFKGSEEPEEGEAANRQKQYRRLMDRWISNKDLKEFHQAIDDPQQCYPEEIIQGLKAMGRANTQEAKSRMAAAIEALEKWCQDYPELTSPACHLANLLIKTGQPQKALKCLDRAITNGFSQEKIGEARSLKAQLKIRILSENLDNLRSGSDCEEALRTISEAEAHIDNPKFIWGVTSRVYTAWAGIDGAQPLLLLDSLADAFQRLFGTFTPNRDNGIRDDLRKSLSDSLVAVAYTPFKPKRENEQISVDRWPGLITALGKVLQIEPNNEQALHMRMMGHYQLAANALQKNDRSGARVQLVNAKPDAERLLEVSSDPSIIKNARQVIEATEKL